MKKRKFKMDVSQNVSFVAHPFTYQNSFEPKKVLYKISFYGLQVKTIDILGVFRYTISKEQGGERYDYPTTIYEHAENLSGCSAGEDTGRNPALW